MFLGGDVNMEEVKDGYVLNETFNVLVPKEIESCLQNFIEAFLAAIRVMGYKMLLYKCSDEKLGEVIAFTKDKCEINLFFYDYDDIISFELYSFNDHKVIVSLEINMHDKDFKNKVFNILNYL